MDATRVGYLVKVNNTFQNVRRGNAFLSMSAKLSSIPLAQEYFYAKASRHPRQPLALICLGVHSSFPVSLAGSEHDQTSGTQTNGHGLAGRLVLKIIGLVSYSIKRSGGIVRARRSPFLPCRLPLESVCIAMPLQSPAGSMLKSGWPDLVVLPSFLCLLA